MKTTTTKKIKSKFIFLKVISYLEENKVFNLIKYSKSFQDLIGVDMDIVKNKCNLANKDEYNNNLILLYKSIYTNKLSNEQFNEVVNYFNNYKNDSMKNQLLKDLTIKIINCKSFDILSKLNNIKKIFNLNIAVFYYDSYYDGVSDYDNNELKFQIDNLIYNEIYNDQQYINSLYDENTIVNTIANNFNKMNKLNINYSSIKFNYSGIDDIKYLKNSNINFNQISKLTFEKRNISDSDGCISCYERMLGQDNINNLNQIGKFFNEFFSLGIIENNLISLKLDLLNPLGIIYEIDPNIFEGVNKFNSLKYLHIDFGFNIIFELKLYNLKELELKTSKNIIFSENNIYKLQSLSLEDCSEELSKSFIQYQLPSLEKLKFINESIKLDNDILKKICLFKKLEKLEIEVSGYEENLNIEEKKNSIQEIAIKLKYLYAKLNLCKLQNTFCNLMQMTLDVKHYFGITRDLKVEFIENKKCKINNINIIANDSSFKLFIQSYESLEHISLNILDMSSTNFPFLNNNCNTVFESLKSIKLITVLKSVEDSEKIKKIINNILNNIDKVPNLREFELKIHSWIDTIKAPNMIDELSYKKLIKKILSLKLIKTVHLNYDESGEAYTRQELTEIFPEINYYRLNEVIIQKFKKEEKNK